MKEEKIQADICQYLSLRNIFYHSVPNEAPGRNKIRAMQMVTMGLRSGVADLVVWFPAVDGVEIGYLEVKTETGSLSKSQKTFKNRCFKKGIYYEVVRSVEDVKRLLKKDWGV